MLSTDLARLYEVPPKALIQAIKRNIERFPADFAFQLTPEEAKILRSQFVTLGWGQYAKYASYAFTEQGVAMLSSVLRSRKAVQANIAIMRAFVKLREMGAQNREILKKLARLENRVDRHDTDIGELIDAIREDVLAEPRKIGFTPRRP